MSDLRTQLDAAAKRFADEIADICGAHFRDLIDGLARVPVPPPRPVTGTCPQHGSGLVQNSRTTAACPHTGCPYTISLVGGGGLKIGAVLCPPHGVGVEPASAPTARPKTPKAPKPRAKGEKRPPEEIAAVTEALHNYIRNTPGQRIEQIAKGMVCETSELMLPIKKLIRAKLIRTVGLLRATAYYPTATQGGALATISAARTAKSKTKVVGRTHKQPKKPAAKVTGRR